MQIQQNLYYFNWTLGGSRGRILRNGSLVRSQVPISEPARPGRALGGPGMPPTCWPNAQTWGSWLSQGLGPLWVGGLCHHGDPHSAAVMGPPFPGT